MGTATYSIEENKLSLGNKNKQIHKLWGKGAHNAWSFRVNGLFGSVFTYVLSVFFL